MNPKAMTSKWRKMKTKMMKMMQMKKRVRAMMKRAQRASQVMTTTMNDWGDMLSSLAPVA